MEDIKKPRPFEEWRIDKGDREEDAAYTFGSHLIKYCRDEVMQSLPENISELEKENIKTAMHESLHNVMDLLEGFWQLNSGEEHTVEYALQVVVRDKNKNLVKKVEISPCKIDLPIGFWKWAWDGEYR